MLTAPRLFARARNAPLPSGPLQCGLCGGPCDDAIPIGSILSDSFTDWQQISGDYLCAACLLTLRADDRESQPRLYSWVLTEKYFIRKTKANLGELRGICLNPPPPPYCIVLADSGQRHLIYRAAVIHDPIVAGAYLEGEQIGYLPADLVARLDLCGRICAATGKSALTDFQPVNLGIALSEYFQYWVEIFEEWEAVHSEPLSRLASWLVENSEQSKLRFPSDVPVQPKKTSKRKGKQNADNSTATTEPAAAIAGGADPAEVSPDHRGAGRSGRESDEPGLFG